MSVACSEADDSNGKQSEERRTYNELWQEALLVDSEVEQILSDCNTNNEDNNDGSHPSCECISEEPEDFFDLFASIRERAERPRQSLPVEPVFTRTNIIHANAAPNDQRISSQGPAENEWPPQPVPRGRPKSRVSSSSPSSLGWIWGPELITGSEADTLYEELLYCIIHAVGKLNTNAEDLFRHLRESFQLSAAKHEELLLSTKQKSPPEISLQVGVMQARALEGKDANGLSDPFCCIWVSSNRQKQQNTTMKPNTLQPVWNEQFSCPVKDVGEDFLHVEIWDFDPDETVKEKMSRLGEVKGCRGFGKLLKEIAIASKAPGKPSHEFLGLVTIPLKSIPVSGTERWYSLEGRDKSKTKDRGEIKLSLQFSADRIEKQYSLTESYSQYLRLLRIFIEQEMRCDPNWRRNIREEGELVLQQLAAQRGMCRAVVDIARWTAFSSALHKRTLCFHHLHDVLQRLGKVLEDDDLPQEMKTIFWNSCEEFVNTALSLVRNIRHNAEMSENAEQLSSLLKCFKTMMGLSSMNSNFSDLRNRMTEAITMGAADWLNLVKGKRKIGGPISDDDRLEYAIRTCQSIMDDLKKTLTSSGVVFCSELQIPYFGIIYEYYDKEVADMCKAIVDSVTRTLKITDLSEEKLEALALQAAGVNQHLDIREPENQAGNDKEFNLKLTMGTSLFELYLCIQQFHRLSNGNLAPQKGYFKLDQFHRWFSVAVGRWLDIAFYKAMARIGKAISMDPLAPVDNLVKHSSSSVDTVTVFYQIKTFWQQLSWPETEEALNITAKIVKDICRCSTFYAESLITKLKRTHLIAASEPFYVSSQICVAIHNILHIQQYISPLAKELGILTLSNARTEQTSESSVSEVIKASIEDAVENMKCTMDELFNCIARQIESEVSKIFSSGFDPNSLVNLRDQLIRYLDANLITLNTQLDSTTFDMLLRVISHRVLNSIHQAILKDVEDKQLPSCFQHWEDMLKVITNFFYGTDDRNEDNDVLIEIRKMLILHGAETGRLMQLYRLERMTEETEQLNLGTISVKALFVKDLLTVEILNARDLKPMDSRGHSDPYIKVELMPSDKFPDSVVAKTKVHKRTLFPLFDETFTFIVPAEQQTDSESYLLFTLKDHDLLTRNEFAGETFLSFQRIARGDSVNALSDMEQIHLSFSKPTNKDSEYLLALERRTWDKAAKEFSKKERKKIGVK